MKREVHRTQDGGLPRGRGKSKIGPRGLLVILAKLCMAREYSHWQGKEKNEVEREAGRHETKKVA